MQTQGRKFVDCSEFPSESNCSLKISGREDEVMKAATEHAVSSHGHAPGPELAASIKASLRDELAGIRGNAAD